MLIKVLLLVSVSFANAQLPFGLSAGPKVNLDFGPNIFGFPLVKLYETFPPIDDIIVQHFHFTTSGPLMVKLQDAFCTGHSFRAYDNFRIILNEQSILNFCGISANNLQPIISPDFREAEFFMDPGEHELVVVVFRSPLGGGKTSLRITLDPIGDGSCNVDIGRMDKKLFAYPHADYKPGEFDIVKYMETGKIN